MARALRTSCTASGLLDAARSAVANLEAFSDEVNALNVFPVPDGDTGTNMVATVRAALDEAERLPADASVERIAAALSFGALMGARGNSGVITSQILRGVAEGLAGKRRFTGLDLANALAIGTRTAYAAVGKPVEGTILTVIREASAAAVAAAERDGGMEPVLAATVEGARAAVAKTPSLLPILKEAGVVDSGGQGLFRLFEGALASVQGKPIHREGEAVIGRVAGPGRAVAAPAFRAGVAALEDDAFGYETVFVVTATASDLDIPRIQADLETLGTSVLVGGDRRRAKVHVHNDRPDAVLAYGLSLGALTRITVENLDTMADDVREARAAAFVGGDGGPGRDANTTGDSLARVGGTAGSTVDSRARGSAKPVRAAVHPRPATTPDRANDADGPGETATQTTTAATAASTGAPAAVGTSMPSGAEGDGASGTTADVEVDPTLAPAIVAVVAGDGLEKVYRDFGVDLILRGGQSANPSTGELLRIARLARSRDVIVLPNNPNVRLAAELAGRICDDRRLVVVPTRNAAEGIAALLAYDPDASAAENAGSMTTAGRALATIQVTEAVRDARIGGKRVKKGQTIALDPDDGLVAVDSDREKAVLKAVETFPDGTELVTVYYGEDATLMEAESIARRIGERIAGDAEVVHGGQPHYRYLISAE